MKALIANFRRGRHVTRPNQMILHVEGCDTRKKAEKYVGKKATYTTPSGKEIKGEVSSPHGNSGALRVLFEHGMPGQSIGKKVTLE